MALWKSELSLFLSGFSLFYIKRVAPVGVAKACNIPTPVCSCYSGTALYETYVVSQRNQDVYFYTS